MKKFKVGVIGIGDISNVYLNNLKKYPDLVELYACASRGLEKAQKKAQEHGITKAYASGEELLADPEVDVLLNLTTPEGHFLYNRMALETGKHVYTEKPLASTFAEGKELLALAKEKGVMIGCAPDTFMGGRLQTMRKLIDDGTIGKVTAAAAFVVSHGHEAHHPNPFFFYQPGAGPLLDIGPYYVVALLSLLGPVESICAFSNRAFDIRTVLTEPHFGEPIPVEVDTHITASLQFKSGAVATLVTSFDAWDTELPKIEIYGTKGALFVTDPDPTFGPGVFGGDVYLRTEKEYRWIGNPRDEAAIKREWITVQQKHAFNSTTHQENARGIGLIDMLYALSDNRPARAGGEMALHALEVMEGILTAAKEQRYVTPVTTFDLPLPLPPADSDAEVQF